jgi:NAD(P)-dependent dehydrogenase (short-subunit alcohol dehydrogenase family)
MSRIASRRFSIDDQKWFASNSGDWNPVHVDPIDARRTVAGAIVVHGMHALLWALDTHLATVNAAPAAVKATFFKPTPIDTEIVLARTSDTEGSAWLEATHDDDVLFTVRVLSGSVPRDHAPALPGRTPARLPPRNLPFDALKGAAGRSPIEGDFAALTGTFPSACDRLDPLRVAGLMTVSRIVGMECPGLHSLLAGVELRFDVPVDVPAIEWCVVRHRIPAAPLRIAVAGGGLTGFIEAFVRPAPVDQVRAAEMTTRVSPVEFEGQRALVIGGSRGLGEVIVKAIAAGGGEVVLTFHSGAADARRVAADVESIGRTCRIEPFNAIDADADACRRLLATAPTHVYYFATPRIGAGHPGRFDSELSARFRAAYVDGFANVVLAAADVGKELRVFYPSSVFVNERPPAQMEYVEAKTAGETTCRMLTRQHPHVGILVSRLPRMNTDQTVSLIGPTPRSAVDVMIHVARQLHRLGRGLTVEDVET